jgi:antitoxin ParD1/3/4
MNITLSPEMQRFLDEKLKTGQFTSASDVIDSALAILRDSETLNEEGLNELRRDIRVGIDQLDNGEGRPWNADEMKALMRERAGLKGTG